MEMEKIVSIGDKVDLKQIKERLKKNEKPPVYPSQILELKENNVLQLSMPYYEGKIIPLAVKDKYEICIYAKNGLYTCNGIIVSRHKTENIFYFEAAIYSELKKIQRREYYRYAYRTNIQYRVIEEKAMTERMIGDLEIQRQIAVWNNAIMMDMSGGGVRMVSDKVMEKNIYIELKIPINFSEGEQMVYIYGKLIRCLPVDQNPQLKDYRVEFVNLDKTMQEKIIRFIFEEERRSLSKSKH